MSAAEELRAAAARIRWRVEKLSLAHWFAASRDDDTLWWVWAEDEEDPRRVLTIQTDNDDAEQEAALAEHIAGWSPPPALAVAAWLEQTADRHHEDTTGRHYELCHSGRWDNHSVPGCPHWVPDPCPDMVAALAVARAVPGGAA